MSNIIPGDEWKEKFKEPRKRKTVKANKRKSERLRLRYSFEIYQDQAQSILKLDTTRKLKGERSSRSAIIRDAIDKYLKTNIK